MQENRSSGSEAAQLRPAPRQAEAHRLRLLPQESLELEASLRMRVSWDSLQTPYFCNCGDNWGGKFRNQVGLYLTPFFIFF
jgi:hypothetical protein